MFHKRYDIVVNIIDNVLDTETQYLVEVLIIHSRICGFVILGSSVKNDFTNNLLYVVSWWVYYDNFGNGICSCSFFFDHSCNIGVESVISIGSASVFDIGI